MKSLARLLVRERAKQAVVRRHESRRVTRPGTTMADACAPPAAKWKDRTPDPSTDASERRPSLKPVSVWFCRLMTRPRASGDRLQVSRAGYAVPQADFLRAKAASRLGRSH